MKWLKVTFQEDSNNPPKENRVIEVIEGVIAPVDLDGGSFRLSPVFQLLDNTSELQFTDTKIYFFNFANSFKVLGKIEARGTEDLRQVVFFSVGLSSIVIITNRHDLLEEFKQTAEAEEIALEIWHVKDNILSGEPEVYLKNGQDGGKYRIPRIDYSALEVTERAVMDEFYASISLLLPKMLAHMPVESGKIRWINDEVNGMITELVYLENYSVTKPTSLSEYSADDLSKPKLRQIIKHQNLDRIIQINSALSYVVTQAFSGAIPILERRSLLRRHSLLGIGNAIVGLNSIARFIDLAFAKIDFEHVITHSMKNASPLSGLDKLALYDSAKWFLSNVDRLAGDGRMAPEAYKLPYFSGRLGFRETQYSIAAALQSVSGGAGLEWSLMTVTHEMLHGHVRTILSSIFFGSEVKNPEALKVEFYERFKRFCQGDRDEIYLIDSVRSILLFYCCMTVSHGSLTKVIPYKVAYDIDIPGESDELWWLLEDEHRNLSEIFVHVLDLHYFYASRVASYIPLIWRSWISLPHIHADLRQYILRSLVAISSKISGNAVQRFFASCSRLKEILESHVSHKLNYPAIHEIIAILGDSVRIKNDYYGAFKASMIIVDLVNNVFISEKVRGRILKDDFVNWVSEETDEQGFEKYFEYGLSSGFQDEIIESPVAYLLDRMIKQLENTNFTSDIERETTLEFLAINSIH